jgi:hypothetical protein
VLYSYDLDELFSETNNKTTVDFDRLLDNYHFDSISSIDSCIRKALVATCSSDRTLVLWNYDTHSIDLRQQFEEDLFSVAMHPSGMYLLLATSNSLKFMSICSNKCKILFVYNVRSCSNCLFSHGGFKFVAVHGTVVQIYTTLTSQEPQSIKTQDMGKIKQLSLTKDDRYLICCSMTGIVRIWDTQTLTVVSELITKGLSYIGLSLHPNQDWLFLISTEKAVRQFQLPKVDNFNAVINPDGEIKLKQKLETRSDENITCIEVNKCGRMLCLGTNKGVIRVYVLLNAGGGQFREYRAHTSSISKICITCFDEYLITCSDDGAVVYWRIGSRLRDSAVVPVLAQVTQAALADQDEYEKQMARDKKWERKLREFEAQADFVTRMRELKFEIKRREMTRRFNAQIVSIVAQIENEIKNDKQTTAKFDLWYAESVSDHVERVDSMVRGYIQRVKKEEDKCNELVNQIALVEKRIGSNSKRLDEMKNDLEDSRLRVAKNFKNFDSSVESLFGLDDDDCDLVEYVIELSFGYEERLKELMDLNKTTKNEIILTRNLLKTNAGIQSEENFRIENEIRVMEELKCDRFEPCFVKKLENVVLAGLISEIHQNRMTFLNIKKRLLLLKSRVF